MLSARSASASALQLSARTTTGNVVSWAWNVRHVSRPGSARDYISQPSGRRAVRGRGLEGGARARRAERVGRPRARGRGSGLGAAAVCGPDLRREPGTQRRVRPRVRARAGARARALPVTLGALRSPHSRPGRGRERRAAGARGGAGGGGQCETGWCCCARACSGPRCTSGTSGCAPRRPPAPPGPVRQVRCRGSAAALVGGHGNGRRGTGRVRTSRDRLNKRVFSSASGELDCAVLLSVCSAAHAMPEGPWSQLGGLLSEGVGERAGAGYAHQDSLCSEEGLTALCVL